MYYKYQNKRCYSRYSIVKLELVIIIVTDSNVHKVNKTYDSRHFKGEEVYEENSCNHVKCHNNLYDVRV